MMQKAPYFFLIILCLVSGTCFAQGTSQRLYEKNSIQVFNDFISYINKCIKKKSDLNDTVELKYILSRYLFTNSKIDTTNSNEVKLNDLSVEKIDHLKSELNSLYQFLQERENIKLAENLSAQQLRLRSDTSIYNRLTNFQKENTLIFFDKRSPGKILGYVLFMHPINNLIASPKIWSWTLMFKFGKFVFRSVTGEEGYEYIFSNNNRDRF